MSDRERFWIMIVAMILSSIVLIVGIITDAQKSQSRHDTLKGESSVSTQP